ncbi:hypothetical protein [Chryseobacterium herbae]|uniref:DUF3592 domain-containing protein n=1 Tax=Chryseobacterium herbae TaxID=2976476 RepID=A0ABT2IS39_9FLAO|nr:hypothetical protein [Chryseobacterium sp. pc1-10]MCT2561537.1 hypothetical protein [Chryseobacterium sp. pc1-10]
MTFFGGFVAVIVLFSIFLGYGIFSKISGKKQDSGKTGGFLEKAFLLFFVSLIMVSMNALTFILSYSFFWEKAYRTFDEPQYTATVIGYKKEITKGKNFSNSSYSDRVIFFPRVEYTGANGEKIVKTLDITSNDPPALGEKVKITDAGNQDSTNAVELDWIMLAAGGVFTGVAAFFATLLATYGTSSVMKKRLRWSLRAGLVLILINVLCIVFIYLKQ